jgi:hypothetical protein
MPVVVTLMVTVPADTPVTIPAELTVAIEGLLLDHVPPVLPASVRLVVAPAHTVCDPNIESADPGETVTIVDAQQPAPVV